MARESETNPFLQGNFGPIRSEDEFTDLKVIGEIPPELNGTYYRNGPNPAFEPKGRYHWFDGDGMIHAVNIRDGRASYRNRYVESRGLQEELAAGRALYPGLLDLGKEMTEAPQFKNTGNTNIVVHAGKLLALMEGALPTQLTADTLATVGEYDFDGKLQTAMTAHPKMDPETGEMLFFGYAPFPPYLTYHVADRSGRLLRSEAIDIEWPSMIHDFVTTRDYVVFILCPLVFSLENITARGNPFSWEPERGTRIGVMPRSGGNADVKWYTTDASYVFHPMNAYVDGRKLVIDVARFGKLVFMDPAEQQKPQGPEVNPRLHRWTIDLDRGGLASEPLDDRVAEFPRTADTRVGLPYRYGYAAGGGSDMGATPTFTAIYKYDHRTGKQDTHQFGAGKGCGEAVFVPRRLTGDEDEGYLLTFVFDAARNASEFVILDAQHVADEPLARIEIPRRVPYGFHGNWVAAG
ncbi:MAG TPA: carotenoid oxygenase family protein [Candidatus Binatia bacterium]|nr:carotenoid oxygenase family protein [Candidatus Binatia bacterium]